MAENCILCANGNDLPEGEQCACCGRQGQDVHAALTSRVSAPVADGQYEAVLNSYAEENQRLSNEIERLRGAPSPALDPATLWESLKQVCGANQDKSQIKSLVQVRERDVHDAIRALAGSVPSTPRDSSEAREKEITRLATIAQCAKLCDELRRKDYSSESADWTAGTLDCATAIRKLADSVPSTVPANAVCDLQALLEIRDFLADIVGGSEITERSRDTATGFVSIMDAQFGSQWDEGAVSQTERGKQ